MKLKVQKFGGTSVQTKEDRDHVFKQIKRALKSNYRLVVVVSAIGRNPSPYATETLLNMVDFPLTHNSKRELDLLMSCGEIISSVVLSNELQQHGIKAAALSGPQAGLITDDNFNDAKIIQIAPERIKLELESFEVVVVAGFQGRTLAGDVTTIGRGGSDTTAAALGAALEADAIEIFTDVNGIMTADPRIVEDARAIDVLTYTEISNLAHQGAKVIHPRAIEIAMEAGIPLYIRSTYSDGTGTLITGSRSREKGVDLKDQLVTGIAHMANISQVTVTIRESTDQALIFITIAEAKISVDFITILKDKVIFTVPANVTIKVVDLLAAHGLTSDVTENCAKVSAVGAGMTGIPGVVAKIVGILVGNGVEILQSADSHTTIWVLIHEEHLKIAINAMHEVFELNKTS